MKIGNWILLYIWDKTRMLKLHLHLSYPTHNHLKHYDTKYFFFLDNTAVGEFDGELLLLRLPLQAYNLGVIELGPDGPGYT